MCVRERAAYVVCVRGAHVTATLSVSVCVREKAAYVTLDGEGNGECNCCMSHYGVATISRLLKITGLLCKRALLKR